MQRSVLCRSRRELSNAYLLAKFGFDTAENEHFKVCNDNCGSLRNTTEAAIAAVWAEVLNLDVARISVEADFVSMGGTSLLAGRAVSKLRKELPAPTLPGTAMSAERQCFLSDECRTV